MWEPRFKAMDFSHSSSSMSSRYWLGGKLPALLTSISMPPNRNTPCCNAEAMASAWVTSHLTLSTAGLENSSSRLSAISNASTAAPWSRNRHTQALPIPDAAPLTTTTLPSNSPRVADDLSLACSSSQYSTSNRSWRGKACQPPRASPHWMALIVCRQMSFTICKRF